MPADHRHRYQLRAQRLPIGELAPIRAQRRGPLHRRWRHGHPQQRAGQQRQRRQRGEHRPPACPLIEQHARRHAEDQRSADADEHHADGTALPMRTGERGGEHDRQLDHQRAAARHQHARAEQGRVVGARRGDRIARCEHGQRDQQQRPAIAAPEQRRREEGHGRKDGREYGGQLSRGCHGNAEIPGNGRQDADADVFGDARQEYRRRQQIDAPVQDRLPSYMGPRLACRAGFGGFRGGASVIPEGATIRQPQRRRKRTVPASAAIMSAKWRPMATNGDRKWRP